MTHTIKVAVDLRHLFGPVRDQEARPTCLAFAASDTHAGLRDSWMALSCEFAFYHAQRRAGRPPTKGALLGSMLDALRLDGQPQEAGWPYLAAVPSDHGLWKPPATVGAVFGRTGAVGGKALAPILVSLDGGRPVILLTTLSRSFFVPDADGVVTPAAGEQPNPAQRHAVIAVGHGTVDGDSAILVRNSWGASWASNGHGWLPESFLTPRLFATATLLEHVDVSPHSAAA
jgi:hypothetical protein